MKHLISILLIFTCSSSIKGQDTFHKLIYPGFPMTRFTGVLPTDSCFYVTGTFSDTISPLRTGALLGKIDLQGELVSIKTVKHPDRLYFNDFGDLMSTDEGALFNVGLVNDTAGSVQGVLYLYNNHGDTLSTYWYRSILYPDFNNVFPRCYQQNDSSDYVIINSHISNENPQDIDISLLILDTSFNSLQYSSFDNLSKIEIPVSMVVDDDGGYIIGAERYQGGVNINFDNRTLIIKTDSTGEQEWQWLSPAGVLQDAAKAMIKTPDGGLVVASGMGDEIGNNPNIHTLVWDGLIFKLDADRNVVWSTPLRGDLPNGGTELTEMVEATDSNGYVASGIVYEKEGPPLGHYTSWLVKVSLEGDSLWARRYTWFDGEFVAPEVWDMKATPDGGYVLVGIAPEVFDIVTNPYIPAWIMKVDSFGCLIPGCYLTDATDEELPEIRLAIYPNPATDYLNFYLRTPRPVKEASFRIVNAGGTLMKSFQSKQTDATFIVPVWDWTAGVYFLQYLDQDNRLLVSEKFIINR